MRLLLLLAFLPFVSGAALAQEARVDGIEIVGKGIYEVQTGAVTKDPSAPTGEIKAPDIFKLITATDTIPAAIGTEFGVEYRLTGMPDGAEATLHFVFAYPAPGIADPTSAKPILSDTFDRQKKIGAVNYLGYGFENPWELVPGTWTMEIWSGDRKLASESFTITK